MNSSDISSVAKIYGINLDILTMVYGGKGYNFDELKNFAREMKIPMYAQMSKQELIEEIKDRIGYYIDDPNKNFNI